MKVKCIYCKKEIEMSFWDWIAGFDKICDYCKDNDCSDDESEAMNIIQGQLDRY